MVGLVLPPLWVDCGDPARSPPGRVWAPEGRAQPPGGLASRQAWRPLESRLWGRFPDLGRAFLWGCVGLWAPRSQVAQYVQGRDGAVPLGTQLRGPHGFSLVPAEAQRRPEDRWPRTGRDSTGRCVGAKSPPGEETSPGLLHPAARARRMEIQEPGGAAGTELWRGEDVSLVGTGTSGVPPRSGDGAGRRGGLRPRRLTGFV